MVMAHLNKTKINQLLTNWPNGTVSVCAWLHRQGFGYDLLSLYRRSGWLCPMGRGAVARVGDKVDWTGGLYAIQEQLRLCIHAGAKTALEMQGYAHFLPLGKGRRVFLFGTRGVRPPAWFRQYGWDVNPSYTTTNLFGREAGLCLTKKEMGAYSITLSSPERAIMETLHLVPRRESFEGARLLFEGLTTLRPKLVQRLLEQCRSIKVKRLFMFLAEKANHAWVARLDQSKLNFGEGKRLIVKGGHLDLKYKITVPIISEAEESS